MCLNISIVDCWNVDSDKKYRRYIRVAKARRLNKQRKGVKKKMGNSAMERNRRRAMEVDNDETSREIERSLDAMTGIVAQLSPSGSNGGGGDSDGGTPLVPDPSQVTPVYDGSSRRRQRDITPVPFIMANDGRHVTGSAHASNVNPNSLTWAYGPDSKKRAPLMAEASSSAAAAAASSSSTPYASSSCLPTAASQSSFPSTAAYPSTLVQYKPKPKPNANAMAQHQPYRKKLAVYIINAVNPASSWPYTFGQTLRMIESIEPELRQEGHALNDFKALLKTNNRLREAGIALILLGGRTAQRMEMGDIEHYLNAVRILQPLYSRYISNQDLLARALVWLNLPMSPSNNSEYPMAPFIFERVQLTGKNVEFELSQYESVIRFVEHWMRRCLTKQVISDLLRKSVSPTGLMVNDSSINASILAAIHRAGTSGITSVFFHTLLKSINGHNFFDRMGRSLLSIIANDATGLAVVRAMYPNITRGAAEAGVVLPPNLNFNHRRAIYLALQSGITVPQLESLVAVIADNGGYADRITRVLAAAAASFGRIDVLESFDLIRKIDLSTERRQMRLLLRMRRDIWMWYLDQIGIRSLDEQSRWIEAGERALEVVRGKGSRYVDRLEEDDDRIDDTPTAPWESLYR